MSVERFPAHGPGWRQPRPPSLEPERIVVVCRCGVDMRFDWPRGEEAVRCFGCGQRFPRPAHIPACERWTWTPPPPQTPWRRLRAWATFPRVVALCASLLAATLLGIGIGLAF